MDALTKVFEEILQSKIESEGLAKKVKRCRSTKTSTNPEFPKEEEAA